MPPGGWRSDRIGASRPSCTPNGTVGFMVVCSRIWVIPRAIWAPAGGLGEQLIPSGLTPGALRDVPGFSLTLLASLSRIKGGEGARFRLLVDLGADHVNSKHRVQGSPHLGGRVLPVVRYLPGMGARCSGNRLRLGSGSCQTGSQQRGRGKKTARARTCAGGYPRRLADSLFILPANGRDSQGH